jgi:hypothetical protein
VCSSFSSTAAVTERLLLRVQGRVDARMAGRMAVLRGGDLNGPATHASGGADPSTTPSESGFKRRARPRGPTVPRRPSGALGQRGPLGPAPLRSGPPAAHGDERAGLRGRPLSVASSNVQFPSLLAGSGPRHDPCPSARPGEPGAECGRGWPGCEQAGRDATCAAERPCRPVGRVPWGEGAALPRRPAQRGMLAKGQRRSARAIVTRRAVRRCGAKKKGVFGRTKLTGRASAHPAYRSRRRAG